MKPHLMAIIPVAPQVAFGPVIFGGAADANGGNGGTGGNGAIGGTGGNGADGGFATREPATTQRGGTGHEINHMA
jgi:hypothetical protein